MHRILCQSFLPVRLVPLAKFFYAFNNILSNNMYLLIYF
ncbi:hypothetical protein HMPREF1320_2168 [Capnocytophaga sp. oral taxon 335 str. F0486]|nr:hypothetical protein HMPREF1320_2168 [Capnocytophaga sp. oral taxon 335 str. F0486]